MFQYIVWTRAASRVDASGELHEIEDMFYLERHRLPIEDLHGPDFDGPARPGSARFLKHEFNMGKTAVILIILKFEPLALRGWAR